MDPEKQKKLIFYLVNGLTIFRLILAVIILMLIFSGQRLQAFIIFLIGILTDLLDGDLARRFNATSEIGSHLDGLADLSLMYSVIIPLFVMNEFTILFKIIVIIVTIGILAVSLEHTIKNKKFTLPGRRPSTTVNSYFCYTNLALFIINSPYKYVMAYLTCFIIAITAFDYFVNQKPK